MGGLRPRETSHVHSVWTPTLTTLPPVFSRKNSPRKETPQNSFQKKVPPAYPWKYGQCSFRYSRFREENPQCGHIGNCIEIFEMLRNEPDRGLQGEKRITFAAAGTADTASHAGMQRSGGLPPPMTPYSMDGSSLQSHKTSQH